jgi:isoleucyl-tRNA synthetase
VFLSSIPAPDEGFIDNELADRWDRLFKERGEVLKALEEARSKGIIGHSLDAKVTLAGSDGKPGALLHELIRSDKDRSQDVLIVSQAEVAGTGAAGTDGELSSYDSELLGSSVTVSKAQGDKCERCWKYDDAVGKDPDHPDVCSRCAAVLASGVTT